MKKYVLLLGISILNFCSWAQPRPNIIVFMVDDMGWMDTSVPFGDSVTILNRRYHTPSMDRLASEGMKFTNAYATPVCTPTRVSMLTGMNAAHHGVTNWTSPQKNSNTDNPDEELAPAPWKINGLSPVPGVEHTVYATPFPKLLKEAGYFTIHVGKAHWAPAGTPGASPYNLGFMVNIAGHAAGHPQSYRGEENFGNNPGKASAQAVPDLEEYFGTDTFLTEALTLEALKALEAPLRSRQPFFLHLAHYAVHDPIQGDERFLQKYLAAGLDPVEARYATLLEGMDKSLGDLIDFLKRHHAEKNTVIIFMSDNGGLSYVPPRGGEAHTQNLPLRAGKGSVYEGGIRVPMLVKWPGVVKPGSVAAQYVVIEDFFPTILEMARVKSFKPIQAIDGISFLPLLKNPDFTDNKRYLFWHAPNKWQRSDGPGINYKSAVRQGDWKLVFNQRTGKNELYNLHTDIGEQKDLATEYPDKVRALAASLSTQLRQWKAPMPVLKSTAKAVAFPDEAAVQENETFNKPIIINH